MARPAIPNKETLRINVSGELAKELKDFAAQNDRTMSDMVRVILKERLNKH